MAWSAGLRSPVATPCGRLVNAAVVERDFAIGFDVGVAFRVVLRRSGGNLANERIGATAQHRQRPPPRQVGGR